MMELVANGGTQFDAEFVDAFHQRDCWKPNPDIALAHRDDL